MVIRFLATYTALFLMIYWNGKCRAKNVEESAAYEIQAIEENKIFRFDYASNDQMDDKTIFFGNFKRASTELFNSNFNKYY